MNGAKVFTASWGQLEGKYSNMGDLIIFEAVIRMLRSIPEVSDVYCYSGDVGHTNSRYGVSSQNPLTVKGLLKTVNNIRRADVVLLGGGELIQTKSSFLYLIANLAPGLLSILFKKKCLAIGAGIADSKEISGIGKVFARFVLNRIEKVCVRDRASLQNGLALGLKREKALLAADLAFQLSETGEIGDNQRGDKVLFCPRFTEVRKGGMLPAWMTKQFKRKKYWSEFNKSAGRFAELLKRMTGEFDVILLPCYNGRGGVGKDKYFSEKIIEMAGYPSNVEIADGPKDFHGICELAKETFVTVAVPVHALIVTSIMSHPAIAISYASKCSSFMEEVRLEPFIMDISESGSDIDSQRIIELIRECRLSQSKLSRSIRESVHGLIGRGKVNYEAVMHSLPQAQSSGLR